MLQLSCSGCKLTFGAYDEWLNHLVSPKHQEHVSYNIQSWDKDLTDRSVIILNIGPKVPELEEQIMYHFSDYGLVTDYFYCDKHPIQFCIVQLDRQEIADLLVTIQHKVLDRTIDVKPKRQYDIIGFGEELKHKQLKDFVSHGMMSKNDLNFRKEVYEHVNSYLTARDDLKLKLCPLTITGTYITRAGLTAEPLLIFAGVCYTDVYMELQNTDQRKSHICQQLTNVQRLLRDSKDYEKDFYVDYQKLFISFTWNEAPCIGLRVQIIFNPLRGLLVNTCQLIHFLSSFDPRISKLIQFVLRWGKHVGLFDIGFNEYTLTLLAIFSATVDGILPKIAQLQILFKEKAKTLFTWDTSYCTDKDVILNYYNTDKKEKPLSCLSNYSPEKLLQTVKDFFHRFSRENLNENMIVLNLGEFVSKSDQYATSFKNSENRAQKRYYNKLNFNLAGSAKKHTSKFSTDGLCVMDPLRLNYNTNSDIATTQQLDEFQRQCSAAYECMDKVIRNELQLKDFLDNLHPKVNDIEIDREQSCIALRERIERTKSFLENAKSVPESTIRSSPSTSSASTTVQAQPKVLWAKVKLFITNQFSTEYYKVLDTYYDDRTIPREKINIIWLFLVQEFLTIAWKKAWYIDVLTQHSESRKRTYSSTFDSPRPKSQKLSDEQRISVESGELEASNGQEGVELLVEQSRPAASIPSPEEIKKKREKLDSKDELTLKMNLHCETRRPFWFDRIEAERQFTASHHPSHSAPVNPLKKQKEISDIAIQKYAKYYHSQQSNVSSPTTKLEIEYKSSMDRNGVGVEVSFGRYESENDSGKDVVECLKKWLFSVYNDFVIFRLRSWISEL